MLLFATCSLLQRKINILQENAESLFDVCLLMMMTLETVFQCCIIIPPLHNKYIGAFTIKKNGKYGQKAISVSASVPAFLRNCKS